MVLALRQVMSDAVWGWFQVLICWPFSHAAAAKSLQSCLTLCDMIDSSPPGSSVLGILQARILEWVVISFSNACYVTSVMSNSMRPYRQQPTRLLCPRDSLGKNTGVGFHFLLPFSHALECNWHEWESDNILSICVSAP